MCGNRELLSHPSRPKVVFYLDFDRCLPPAFYFRTMLRDQRVVSNLLWQEFTRGCGERELFIINGLIAAAELIAVD
jgi:hypothetical protein